MRIKITINLTPEQYSAIKRYLHEVGEVDKVTREDVVSELENFASFETYRHVCPAIESYLKGE